MPKIPPRESVREHPLYRTAMAAQHAAYQLMRDVPAASKADAARLHAALVNATTWAVAIVDPGVGAPEKEAARRGFATSVERANELLGSLAPLANDAGIVEILEKKVDELRMVDAGTKATPQAEPVP
jgi:hypothetical protein